MAALAEGYANSSRMTAIMAFWRRDVGAIPGAPKAQRCGFALVHRFARDTQASILVEASILGVTLITGLMIFGFLADYSRARTKAQQIAPIVADMLVASDGLTPGKLNATQSTINALYLNYLTTKTQTVDVTITAIKIDQTQNSKIYWQVSIPFNTTPTYNTAARCQNLTGTLPANINTKNSFLLKIDVKLNYTLPIFSSGIANILVAAKLLASTTTTTLTYNHTYYLRPGYADEVQITASSMC